MKGSAGPAYLDGCITNRIAAAADSFGKLSSDPKLIDALVRRTASVCEMIDSTRRIDSANNPFDDIYSQYTSVYRTLPDGSD